MWYIPLLIISKLCFVVYLRIYLFKREKYAVCDNNKQEKGAMR